MFGLIAQVRGEKQLFAPKGIPENLGFSAQDDWYLLISEDKGADNIEGYTSLHNAERWKNSMGCKIVEYDGKPHKVEHPDWHTPTWLTPSELRQALERTNDKDVYNAILIMMEALEKEDKIVRMVIWFDN